MARRTYRAGKIGVSFDGDICTHAALPTRSPPEGGVGDLVAPFRRVSRQPPGRTGLAGFAGVSAVGGASVSFAMLITARACQGAFAALLVPSALSLLTTTFTEKKDRGKAFGIYGAIAAAGGAVGLLIGGIFAGGAVVAGALLRREPLDQQGTPSPAHGGVTTAQAETGPALVTAPRANRLINLRGFLIHYPVLASARSWVICAATIMVDGCTGVRSASIWRTQSQALPRCPSVASMVDE